MNIVALLTFVMTLILNPNSFTYQIKTITFHTKLNSHEHHIMMAFTNTIAYFTDGLQMFLLLL